MGPIGTVRKSYLPFGFSKGNVDMQLTEIKRVDRDKELLTALVTVKNGKEYVTESATLKWNVKREGFVVRSNGVKTLYSDSDTIKVEFSIEEINLHETLTLKINKLINDVNKLKEHVDELKEDHEELEKDVDELKEDHEELEKDVNEVIDACLNDLTDNVEMIQSYLNDLTDDVVMIDACLNDLKEDIEVIDTNLNDLTYDVDVIDASLNDLTDDVEVIDTSLNDLTDDVEEIDASLNDLKEDVEEISQEKVNYDFSFSIKNPIVTWYDADTDQDQFVTQLATVETEKATLGTAIFATAVENNGNKGFISSETNFIADLASVEEILGKEEFEKLEPRSQAIGFILQQEQDEGADPIPRIVKDIPGTVREMIMATINNVTYNFNRTLAIANYQLTYNPDRPIDYYPDIVYQTARGDKLTVKIEPGHMRRYIFDLIIPREITTMT